MLDHFLKNKKNSKLLSKTILGLERETVRTSSKAEISQKTHPIGLGSAYTHPLIKTDFSESQVEYSTKPSAKTKSVLKNLSDLHVFTWENLDSEGLWPFSMPPKLPESEAKIPLAIYGDTEDAKKKTIYRNGLGFRYGRKMQTISGVHVNVSFSKSLMEWASMQRFGKKLDIHTQSQLYLDTIRNFNRYSFLILYFFGASPAMDSSFTKKLPGLEKWDDNTFYGPHATTLRLSELGYTSQVQNSLYISFNSLKEYINGLCKAISTTFAPYSQYNPKKSSSKLKQLNDFYLQIENEYYTLVRPKQIPRSGERPIDSLNERGIRYIEVRCIDADPFSPIGVSEEAILFTQLYLLYCLLNDSPKMDEAEKKQWDNNQYEVVWNGRDLNTKYKVFEENKTIVEWGNQILDKLQGIAEFWDQETKSVKFTEVIKNQRFKLSHPEETPSGAILKIFERDKIGFLELGMRLSKKYMNYFSQRGIDSCLRSDLLEMSKVSFAELKKLEEADKIREKNLDKKHSKNLEIDKASEIIKTKNSDKSNRPTLVELAKVCCGRS
ncbi:glutamate--cysteine ligase [Leptospira sp. GIMC2001]|uniref:glutamate--cysteine ligase n=1 Tax=Leptospira sp. GIMC2001 TaxID=1513297 RepID=UPI00234A9FE5|nr:glutamate--cysteine ligase [Leptospira sp. GIMC2001]WCL51136.1 glutamate--cysteine ligase [Leptospira sp. GIMC2001]